MRADAGQVSIGSPTSIVGAAAIRGRVRRARGDVDGRSAVAKRAQALVGRFVGALGGPACVSPVQMLQVRRAAELTVTAEQMRASALRGERVDPLALVRLENLAGRVVAALGLDKRREPAGPTLQEYFAARAGEAGEIAEPADQRAADDEGAAS
jgi:hypothetical protein